MKNQALTSEEIREKDKTVDAISNFEWSYEQFNKRMRSLYPDGYNHITKLSLIYYVKRGTK